MRGRESARKLVEGDVMEGREPSVVKLLPLHSCTIPITLPVEHLRTVTCSPWVSALDVAGL